MENLVSVYIGQTHHSRKFPTVHNFVNKLSCYSILLPDDETLLSKELVKANRRGRYYRHHYFGDSNTPLRQSVLQKASELMNKTIDGDVYFFGQLSEYGFYFSSVNFYIIKENDVAKYLLSEVTNTPWGKRHIYCQDLQQIKSHPKEFHVSPFNPMDMTYHWDIKVTDEALFINIDCHRNLVEFSAGVSVIESKRKDGYLLMPLRMLVLIYYNALILFFKKTPFYNYPKESL